MRPAARARVSHKDLLEEVRRSLSASGRGERALRIGLEVEVIPLGPDGARLPLAPPRGGGPSALGLVEAAARAEGWTPVEGARGSPAFRLPEGGSVAFEPGGQVEVRTPPTPSPWAALGMARAGLEALYRAADGLGATLLSRGMDPTTSDTRVRLGLESPRYRRQLRHYESVGPWGRRMMLMSAAVHLNVDLGGRPVRRWGLANRMAPYLVALFANSPRYGGRDTGLRSWRAEQWRHLDPSRTGLFPDEGDPARDYLAFALGARDFLGGPEAGPAVPFRTRWDEGADLEAWRAHLTTLFPEVRPRGYLEIRSVDALRPAWLAVPVLLVTGVLYDPRALEEARALLPPADPERLLRAGRVGLEDGELAATGLQLLDLGLEGAGRMWRGPEMDEALEVARAFRERFTRRGLDPGHEEDGLPPFQL